MVTGEAAPEPAEKPLTPIQEAARMMGKKGGPKGGRARAKKLTAEQLSETGRKAARARWEKKQATN
jgi:hypothetical protein